MLCRICMCTYCHRRHVENHVYQTWYKICMFAKMKTPVKFICILSLGKAPKCTINTTIPWRLSLLHHRHVTLRISVPLKLISSLTETQATSPTFLQKDIWYKWTKRKKVPISSETSSFKKCGLCQGTLLGKPPSLLPGRSRRAEQTARSPSP